MLINLHRQSSINSKMKPNGSIPNIDEHNKANSIFFRICLVPRASSMSFDDGEVHCRVYDSWLSRIYKLESELDLLEYCDISILTSTILSQNKLKHTLCCCMHLMLQKMGNWWKKVGKLLWFAQFAKVFSPPKFLLYGICISSELDKLLFHVSQ